jgi:uncharacterized protein
MVKDRITTDKIERYLKITDMAIRKIKIAMPKGTHLDKVAKDMLDMAQRYHNDAGHFKKKGDYLNAFAAVNYAHGWLDVGARIGVFDVDHDSKLFTVD